MFISFTMRVNKPAVLGIVVSIRTRSLFSVSVTGSSFQCLPLLVESLLALELLMQPLCSKRCARYRRQCCRCHRVHCQCLFPTDAVANACVL